MSYCSVCGEKLIQKQCEINRTVSYCLKDKQ